MTNTHAVGQMQGYLLQARYMLYELISFDDITISIEKFDDIAVELDDGTIVAVQIKSVTSDNNNPISDSAIAFWKSLYNWFEYVINGSLTIEHTKFRFVVISNKSLNQGDIVQSFNNALDEQQARTALQKAKTKLLNKKDESNSKLYDKYLIKLFASENEDIFIRIIMKMSVKCYDSNYDVELRKKFSLNIPPEFVDILFNYILGWVSNHVNESLKQGKPALIKSSDYKKALFAQMRMYQQNYSIPALAQEISESSAITELKQQDIYIRQLNLIDAEYETKLDAASDFLRTKAEIVMRADKGLVAEQGLDEYYDKLRRLWKNNRQILILSSSSDINKGKELYYQTSASVINYRLQGGDVPGFFGSGCLQTLANEPKDSPTIGWHPKYKSLLKKEDKPNE